MDAVRIDEFAAAAGLDRSDGHHVALVGGGGKTTILHALGRQLGGAMVLTCTTKMGHDQHRGLPVLLDPTDDDVVRAARAGPVMVWAGIDEHRAVGVSPERCDSWFSMLDHVVIEADGSRRRPFKAPADYEPVVPSSVTTMISVIGADALGEVIADCCHRPELVAELSMLDESDRLTPTAAATVLVHDRGARKALPEGAELLIACTKVDDANRALVDELEGRLLALDPSLGLVKVAFGSG